MEWLRYLSITIVMLCAQSFVNGRHYDYNSPSNDDDKDICPSLSCNFQMLERLLTTENTIKDLITRLERLESKSFAGVAFNVRQSSDIDVAKGNKFKYNVAIYNKNDVFDQTNDWFMAPYAGIYTFTAQACMRSEYVGLIDIMHQSVGITNPVVIGRVRIGNKDNPTCNSGTAIIRLGESDKVWVQRSVDDDGATGNFRSKYWIKFDGALITAELTSLP